MHAYIIANNVCHAHHCFTLIHSYTILSKLALSYIPIMNILLCHMRSIGYAINNTCSYRYNDDTIMIIITIVICNATQDGTTSSSLPIFIPACTTVNIHRHVVRAHRLHNPSYIYVHVHVHVQNHNPKLVFMN